MLYEYINLLYKIFSGSWNCFFLLKYSIRFGSLLVLQLSITRRKCSYVFLQSQNVKYFVHPNWHSCGVTYIYWDLIDATVIFKSLGILSYFSAVMIPLTCALGNGGKDLYAGQFCGDWPTFIEVSRATVQWVPADKYIQITFNVIIILKLFLSLDWPIFGHMVIPLI